MHRLYTVYALRDNSKRRHTYFTPALHVNDTISSAISDFITIIISKYGAEYTRFTESVEGEINALGLNGCDLQ